MNKHTLLERTVISKGYSVFFFLFFLFFVIQAIDKGALFLRLILLLFMAFQHFFLIESIKKNNHMLSVYLMYVKNNGSRETRLLILISLIVFYSVIAFLGLVDFTYRY